jgi:O-6-methylguanine DNA methyltransferase
MDTPSYVYYESPLGLIEVGAAAGAVVSLHFVDERRHDSSGDRLLTKAAAQLAEYFNGNRRTFALPLRLSGTAFQVRVWWQLKEIPFGKTVSYRDVAVAVGNAKAVRAVGAANGSNPIALVLPCHRVIGSDGSLTGYGGGLWRKRWLLKHEGALLV